MSTITWLHLSDLHFRRDKLTKWNQDIVLRALLEDIVKRKDEDGLQPDFIVVSGDIAYSGAAKEYALAAAFFDDLLKATGLDKGRLFVAPGNHDVDQNKSDFLVEAAEGRIIECGDDEKKGRDAVAKILDRAQSRRAMFQRLDGYKRFTKKYFGSALAVDSTFGSYAQVLDLAER